MKESVLERDFRKKIEHLGCLCIKFEDNAHPGAPDRLILTPTGQAMFIEWKYPGNVPEPHQRQYMEKLHVMGYPVGWVDNVNDAIRWVAKYLPGVELW